MDDSSQRRIPHTYDQAAAALGIKPEAVRARRRRGDLTRGPNANDGRPTVLLSEAEIATIRARVRTVRPEADPASTPEAAPDSTGRPDGQDRMVRALEDAQALLRDQLALLRDQLGEDRATLETAVLELKARAEKAEIQVSAEGARADRAEAERDTARAETAAERARAVQAEREREAARVAAAEAAGEARGLREALAEARRPWWRRWMG